MGLKICKMYFLKALFLLSHNLKRVYFMELFSDAKIETISVTKKKTQNHTSIHPNSNKIKLIIISRGIV